MTHSVRAYDERNRGVLSLKSQEANLLVANGFAEWRGRKYGAAIRLVGVTKHQLITFLGQMRLKPTPEARGLDSKTHSRERLVYRHIRNSAYVDALGRLMNHADPPPSMPR